MARSTYVYCVCKTQYSFAGELLSREVLGTFTVKYEAVAKLEDMSIECAYVLELIRYRDGKIGEGTVIPWNE